MSERQLSKRLSRRQFIRGLGAAAAVTVAGASAPRAAGANERLGVGFIGCGGRAGAHMNIVKKLQEEGIARPVAVCDVYRPRLQAAAQKCGQDRKSDG